MKNLIQCPNCKKAGKKEILAEVDSSGRAIVLRFHQGSTIFESNEYLLRCRCGYIVYRKTDGTLVLT